MKRSAPIKRGGPIARGKRRKARNPARRARELARTYGSAERRRWMRGLPCVCCGRGPCDQSHVRSRSGAGRKGDARMVVPMCRPDHRLYDDAAAFAARYPTLDLVAIAARLEAEWQALGGRVPFEDSAA